MILPIFGITLAHRESLDADGEGHDEDVPAGAEAGDGEADEDEEQEPGWQFDSIFVAQKMAPISAKKPARSVI